VHPERRAPGSSDDRPAGSSLAGVGAALRHTEAALRLALAVAWIGLAATDPSVAGWTGGLLRSTLAACGALSATGHFPRGTTLMGLVLAGVLAPAHLGPGASVAIAAAALARLAAHGGGGGRWLREVRRLEAERLGALAATGLARARARSGEGGALGEAGDAYERAGHASRGIRELGAEPSRIGGAVRPAAELVGRALASAPALRLRLERRLG
jgi:hypothetical protein